MKKLYEDFLLTTPRLGWTLVHSMWQVMVIAGALLIVLQMVCVSRSRLRYGLSCVALFLIIPTSITTYLWVGSTTEVFAGASSLSMQAVSISDGQLTRQGSIAREKALSQQVDHDYLFCGVSVIWMAGVLVCSARQTVGWMRLKRLREGQVNAALQFSVDGLCHRLQIGQRVKLIESDRLNVPAVIGSFRPLILLPLGLINELSAGQIEAILLHELAHVARRDFLVNLCQAVVETLVFYHPAAWWISSQIRQEREHCCDDVAAHHCSDRGEYAGALLALEERRHSAWGLAMGATDGLLLNRVRRVLKVPVASGHHPMKLLVAVGSIAFCCWVPFAVLARPQPATTEMTIDAVSGEISINDLEGDNNDYRIGVKDELKISVVRKTPIPIKEVENFSAIGRFTGQRVPEVVDELTKTFSIEKSGERAEVSVSISKSPTYVFSVTGQVARPGSYLIPAMKARLTDAVKLAGGGLTQCSQIRVTRAASSDQPARTITVSLARLNDKDAKVNIVIRPGDVLLFCPQSETKPPEKLGSDSKAGESRIGEYYITGQVPRVGVYALSGREITLKQAVIAAGGDDAETSNYYLSVLRRVDGKEYWPLINARYLDLFSGKQADILLRAYDIIRVTKNPVQEDNKAATRPSIIK